MGLGLISCEAPIKEEVQYSDYPFFDNLMYNPIVYGADKFVTVKLESNLFSVSYDGVDWTAPGSISMGSDVIKSVSYAKDKFFITATNGRYFTSSDCTVWTPHNAISPGWNWFGGGKCIVYGNGKFVAKSSSRIAYSDNGISWTVVDKFFHSLNVIVFGDGKFVAGASEMYYSLDGINWEETASHPFGNTSRIDAISYNGSIFVAVGTSHKIAYSNNGINWIEASHPFDSIQGSSLCLFTKLDFGNGIFLTGSQYGLLYSVNGYDWERAKDLVFNRNPALLLGVFREIVYGNGFFMIINSTQIEYFTLAEVTTTGNEKQKRKNRFS